MLTVRHLSRAGLVEPVDLTVAAGEAVAVLGPSGSGKSLLLRAIADLDPNEGAVSLDGDARETMPAPRWRQKVAYLPAEPGWWAETARAHFPDAEAVRPLAERLDLPEDVLDRTIATLSTGERQRLALIRLLLQEPPVLLLDEPTSGLDQTSAAKVEEIIRERLATGCAILFATHDKAQAGRLAERCLKMAAGQLSEAAL
ncbi:MAG: ATP-binding cassette domain-containing protein [Alphaproteobacteria bacterium]|nr:ATP-binding cassette domain-containing protein [Alphaproteobacteria bacterium]